MPGERPTYFRRSREDEDPAELLHPSEQHSTPWGEPEHGPCDKCGGSGEADFECRSCLEEGSLAHCLACEGRVRWRGTCPACEGTGEITRTTRRGVSVFPSLGGLYRYLAERDPDLDGWVIVELEGDISDDVDLDADAGALLVFPTQIVHVHAGDPELLAKIAARLE